MPTNLKSRQKSANNPEKPLDESLQRFLDSFEQLPGKIANGMREQITDEDERQVADSFSATLEEQVRELCAFIRGNAVRLSAQGRADLANVMRISAGNSLVASGSKLAGNLDSTAAKIGLSEIIHLIKKILKALLDVFGISLPKWFDKLLELIDELLDMFLSIGSPQLGHTLSRMHQDYLGEMAQLERLQRESSWRFQVEESEA